MNDSSAIHHRDGHRVHNGGSANIDTLGDDVILYMTEMALLSHRDILNLRITCRGLSSNLMEWFRRELPHFRNGMPEQFRARLSSYSQLEGFKTFTKAGLIADQITKLRINVAEFNLGGLSNLMHHSNVAGRYGKVFLQNITDAPIRLLNNGDFTADLHEDRHLRYQQDYIEEEWMNASGEHKEMFTEGFSRLPNLKEVIIGGWSLAHRDTSGSRDSEYMLPHDEAFGCRVRTAAVKTILEHLALYPRALEKLVIQQNGHWSIDLSNEEAGIWAFDIPGPAFDSLLTSTSHLKMVHLTLSDGTFTHGAGRTSNIAPGGFAKKAGQQAFIRFLAASPTIESFSLAAAKDTLFPTSFIQAVLNTLPPTLSSIHLHHIVSTVKDLNGFFYEHRAELRSVGLSRIYLLEEDWMPVFKLVKDHLLSLEAIHLEQLWELDADSSNKLHFTSPENMLAPNRLGHPRCGAFVEGRFVPAQRYDAMTSSGFGGDLSGEWKMESVQECLAKAIWDADREDGCRIWDVPLPERIVNHLREMFGQEAEGGSMSCTCDERLQISWEDTMGSILWV